MENLLAQDDRVREVAVVTYPDEWLGERGCAVIVPDGEASAPDELKHYVEKAGLARQFWPERLEITGAMPRTPSGKIKKYVLGRWWPVSRLRRACPSNGRTPPSGPDNAR